MVTHYADAAGVFPTGVGMNRVTAATEQFVASVPHGRGDEPEIEMNIEKLMECSPRAWG